MLVKMLDGGILEVNYDSDFTDGCDTCNYGSEYTQEYFFKLTKGTIHYKASEMYENPFSEGEMMELILSNVDLIKEMSEDGFYNWLDKKLDDFGGEFNFIKEETK